MLANFSGFQAALIGLAVLVFFIARQFNARRVSSPWMLATPLVLGYFSLLTIVAPRPFRRHQRPVIPTV